VIRSDFAPLDDQAGKFTAVPPPAERTGRASAVHANWWVDDPDPAAAGGIHPRAKHVNRWRKELLRDFARRMHRFRVPAHTGSEGSTRDTARRWSCYRRRPQGKHASGFI